jgi:hypothetical protein
MVSLQFTYIYTGEFINKWNLRNYRKPSLFRSNPLIFKDNQEKFFSSNFWNNFAFCNLVKKILILKSRLHLWQSFSPQALRSTENWPGSHISFMACVINCKENLLPWERCWGGRCWFLSLSSSWLGRRNCSELEFLKAKLLLLLRC